jgi:hypothetical protein
MQVTREALTLALNRKRFRWVDMVLKEELPPDIYGSMHSNNFSDHQRAVHWMKEHGYHVQDAGDGVIQIFRGTSLVRQTKMVLELKDPAEMMAVMEAVTENVNIPPPPWVPKPPP